MVTTGRGVAEGLGSALLLLAVAGSGIMAERLAGGNGALALLCNSLATGAALVVLITIFAPLSGAHFNPVVSLSLWWRSELSGRDVAIYIAAQILGAIAGVWLAHLMFSEAILQISDTVRSGPGLWVSEAVATFGLLLTIILTSRHRPDSVATNVGLYITSAYWFTASTSFANPAVTIARTLTDTFTGIRPIDAPAFILAQFAGALICVAILRPLTSASER